MTVELAEIREFLASVPPFSELPPEILDAIPARLTMRYARRGEAIVQAGAPNNDVFLVRSGLIDVYDASGTLLDRRDVGDHFGYSTLMSGAPSIYTMTAIEDSLLLVMHADVFTDLMDRHQEVSRYYGSQNARIRAIGSAVRNSSTSTSMSTRVRELMSTKLITAAPDTSIRDCAAMMHDRGVSSLLIVDEGDGGRLAGILTDRDLRGRVVAAGVDTNLPVAEVMTADPVTVTPSMLVFEAMLHMAQRGHHHLPVTEDGELVGMVVIGDLLRSLRSDPVYATANLARCESVAEIAAIAADSRKSVAGFTERGFGADEVSRLLTATADAVTRRLLVLAEQRFGEPPVPYAFVVLGSHGRREMGLASDQDSALVLDDAYVADTHGPYFAELTDWVCHALDECGYPLCPGDMMASNPQWRMTVAEWSRTFHGWVTAPDGDALLHAQTFFDLRTIHGDGALVDKLRDSYVPVAQNSPRLHAHLASLAANREPPLGFFRGLVLEKGGAHANTLDVKKGGTAAIVQMARLFAVAAGLPQVGTRERLEAAAGAGTVSAKGARNLRDAFDFLTTVVAHHQGAQVAAGAAPDNHLGPGELSKLEREHLRDAFSVIRDMQQALSSKYPVRAVS